MKEIFSKLSPATLSRLKEVLHTRSFETDQRIFIQDAPAEAIYFIIEGQIKITRVTMDGNEIILCMRHPGDIFCPVPVLDNGDQIGTAIALTEGQLSWVEKDIFINLCAKFPDLLSLVQGDCMFEVRRILHRMESYAFHSIKERLAITLLDILNRNKPQSIEDNVIFMKQSDLASLIGASRESISRTLSQFEEQGILKTSRGKINILCPDKLKLIAEFSEK